MTKSVVDPTPPGTGGILLPVDDGRNQINVEMPAIAANPRETVILRGMNDQPSKHRRWFQFGLGSLFLAVTALAVAFWAYPKPPPFEVYGNLSRADQRAIVAAVRAHSQVRDKRILSIEVTGPTSVEVHTGWTDGPLSGGGDVAELEKEADQWKITDIGGWMG